MDRLPPLNPLRSFEMAARLLSVRKAAMALFVTPAAVSKQIKALELHLGIELFVRRNQALELTQAGEKYYVHVSSALNSIRHATLEARESMGKRTLKIRAYTTFSMHWLIPRLSSFHSQHPEINIELSTSLQWIDFDKEDVDGAIRIGNGNWPGLQADPVVPNVLLPVCNKDTARGLKEPGDLARFTLLHSLARPDDWHHWLDGLGLEGVDPYGGRLYESSALAYQAAIQGQGVALAQKALIGADIEKGNLVFPFSREVDMQRFMYYFVIPKSRPLSVELETFRHWLLMQRSTD